MANILESTNRVDVPSTRIATVAKKLESLIQDGNRNVILGQGELIYETIRGEYWRRWPNKNFASLDDWAQDFLRYSPRKARKISQVWYWLVKEINPEASVLQRAVRLGWSRLVELLPVVDSAKSLKTWLNHIEKNSISQITLREHIRAAREGKAVRTAKGKVVHFNSQVPTHEEESSESSVAESDVIEEKKPTPRARKAQVIDKPKVSTALDKIMLVDPTAAPEEPEEEVEEDNDYVVDRQVRINKNIVFTKSEDHMIVNRACDIVRSRTGESMGDGSALAMISTYYIATQPPASGNDLLTEVEMACRAIEANYGVPVGILSKHGLLRRVFELLSAWQCDQHNDERVRVLYEDLKESLRANVTIPEA